MSGLNFLSKALKSLKSRYKVPFREKFHRPHFARDDGIQLIVIIVSISNSFIYLQFLTLGEVS